MSTYSALQIDADFVGSALCIDFANTFSIDADGTVFDVFNTFAEFIKWAEQARILSATEVEDIFTRSQAEPAAVNRVLAEIKLLRRHLHGIFFAVADKQQPPAAAIAGLNSAIAAVYTKLCLKLQDQHYAWSWAGWAESLSAPIWPVVRSAAELLNSKELVYTRKCHSADCSWLFVDKSKNHRRRWCDMQVCGNRAQARNTALAD